MTAPAHHPAKATTRPRRPEAAAAEVIARLEATRRLTVTVHNVEWAVDALGS